MLSLGWLDVGMLAVLLVSAVVGLWRGVVYEVLSLAGWLISWFVAQAWGRSVAGSYLPSGWPPALNGVVGYAVLFMGTMLVWRLLVWLIQQLLHASPIAPVDRALGSVFGLLRGVVIILVLVMVVGFTPLSQGEGWRGSLGVQWAQWGLTALAPLLPGEGWIDGIKAVPGAASGPVI